MAVSEHKRADDRNHSVYTTHCADHLTVAFPETSGLQRLFVIDCSGKTVFSKKLDFNQVQVVVDSGRFVLGAYFVTLCDNRNRMVARRMVIIH
jgi:hypothetical protein